MIFGLCRLTALAVKKVHTSFINNLFGFGDAMLDGLFAAGVIIWADKASFPRFFRCPIRDSASSSILITLLDWRRADQTVFVLDILFWPGCHGLACSWIASARFAAEK